jgi:hypothetical protein
VKPTGGENMRIVTALATLVILGLWSFSAMATPVYAITEGGDMLFYKHIGTADGSPNWPIQAKKIGNGWNFKQVFAGR